jgi:hypothetical protein
MLHDEIRKRVSAQPLYSPLYLLVSGGIVKKIIRLE